ncbi:helicase-related protein [Alicyclobacillus shizuokensis]|uniref:helicase-related protein n=1 Tax=Alicyclobacillus shizuokensis TaxID=392014 RepID=UPI000832EC6D|nr:DEAD/DEAH box helicase [Alicyclobacillus shizuokensis]
MGAVIPYITEHMSKGKVDPYRALVFVPGIMVEKWKREIKERVPGAKVYEITSWRNVLKMEKMPYRPSEIEYWVMSSDVAKATYPMEPIQDWRYNAADAKERKANGEKARIRFRREPYFNINTGREEETVVTTDTGFHCPQCGGLLMARKKEPADEHFFQTKRNGKWMNTMKAENYVCRNRVRTADLPKHMVKDPSKHEQECGFVLWRPALLKKDSLNRKVSPAWMINKRLRRGFFKYLIADEVHEYKSGETDRAKAFGQLINHTEKQILLTGTLLGGMASDIFYLLARLDPKRLLRESISYNDLSLFIERYGVYEHSYKQHLGNGRPLSNRKKSGMRERAGVSPHVFSRYLISNCAFVELADLGYALPPYREEPIFVEMDERHFAAYKQVEDEIGSIMRQSLFLTGGMRHVSTYINTLYQYSDTPWNWGPITYEDNEGLTHVITVPTNFDPSTFIPTKYHELTLKLDDEIHRRGRKVLVYCRFTGSNGVDTYLYEKLKADGYNVGILKASGVYDGIQMPKQEDREAWLHEMMEKHDWDVLITNPRLVSVGLDLLMFPTIIYYQMDYSTYNYMQSSRRSWRIKQTQPVEVYTMVYRDTIQANVLEHIARKIDAALALQGKFSEEGLRAMADSGEGITALAKKLVNEGTLDDVSSIESRWQRINATYEELQNATFEGYDGYDMNPLGIEEVRRIQQGIVKQMQEDVAAGRISALDLADYLAHVEEMFTLVQDAASYNKGKRKKELVAEGQYELALF